MRGYDQVKTAPVVQCALTRADLATSDDNRADCHGNGGLDRVNDGDAQSAF